MSKIRRRAATANDADLTVKKRTTTVDYLNAFGGIEEEADEAEGYADIFRAKSVDFIREKAAKEKKRSSSIDLVVDDLMKTFMNSGRTEPKPKSRNASRSSVDILNQYGGIAEEDENEDS